MFTNHLPPSTRRHRAEDDFWLVQLYVVIRAAREPLSEESILAYVIRRKLRDVTATKAGSNTFIDSRSRVRGAVFHQIK
jgi:hypothetical protein